MNPVKTCFMTIVLVGSVCGSIALAQQQPVSIDIINATLNSSKVFEMTVDDVTTFLGRPSSVEENRLVAEVGPQVHYHPHGLSFWFEGKKKSPEQRLFTLTIYLSKAWDAKAGKFFEPFQGRLTKDISGNWKSDRTVDEFKDYSMKIRSPDEMERQFKQAGVYRSGITLNYLVMFQLPTHSVNFAHEAVTRFLERVTIVK